MLEMLEAARAWIKVKFHEILLWPSIWSVSLANLTSFCFCISSGSLIDIFYSYFTWITLFIRNQDVFDWIHENASQKTGFFEVIHCFFTAPYLPPRLLPFWASCLLEKRWRHLLLFIIPSHRNGGHMSAWVHLILIQTGTWACEVPNIVQLCGAYGKKGERVFSIGVPTATRKQQFPVLR